MGNCCADAGKDGEFRGGNLQGIKQSDASAFLLKDYQTKFVPQTFSTIAPAEKDQLLAEVLNIIMKHGDLSRVKPQNPNLREIFKVVNSKFAIGGDQFEGDTIDGVANGKAKVIYKDDQSKVEGTMCNGYFQGEGAYTNTDGSTGRGTFYKGHLEGLVEEKKGDVTYQYLVSQWSQNGPELMRDKNHLVFSNWRNNQKEGFEVCIVKDANKITLTEYKADKAVGPAKEYILDPSIKTSKVQAHPAPQQAPPAKDAKAPADPKAPADGKAPADAKAPADGKVPAPQPQPAATPQNK